MKNIKKLDKSNMLDILLDLPRQCERAVELADSFAMPAGYAHKHFDKIFFAGVGGSAIGADIIRTYLSSQLDKPVIVGRNYDVPAFVDKNTLVFVSSYSGNTEETLSAYKKIRPKSDRIIVVTSGGRLQHWAKKDHIPYILVPQGLPPRAAIGYMALIPLVVLSNMKLIKRQAHYIKEVIDILTDLKEKTLGPHIPAPKNIAKDIASKIYGRFVIIYGAEDFLGGVVTRCRQELEENAKIVCSSALLPEMNHNEITGWEDPMRITKDFAIIILRDKDEHPRTSRRIEISKELIAKKTKNIIEIQSCGRSLLARTFSLIYIGAFISFYLAILNGVDPTPVDNVTYLKKRLGQL